MDPLKIIQKYYDINSKAYKILVEHGEHVKKKALEIAKNVPELNPDLKFIEETSMLHDIGIILTNTPNLYCSGENPYISHGYLGGELLEKEGYPKHALVCERHVGVGMTVKEIEEQNLPIPKREMLPISTEEKIVCLADKFFSKREGELGKEKSMEKIRNEIKRFGNEQLKRFDKLVEEFLS